MCQTSIRPSLNHSNIVTGTVGGNPYVFEMGGYESGAAIYAATENPANAHPDQFAIFENSVVSGANVFNDNGFGADEGKQPLTVTAVNGNSSAVGKTIALASGALVTLAADGSLTYDPNHAFDQLPAPGSGASNSSEVDTFSYTIQDGSLATVSIHVTGVDSNDLLLDTLGLDHLSGGIGNDTYHVSNARDTVTEAVGAGNDTVIAYVNYALAPGQEIETLTAAGTVPRNLTGNEFDNRIVGNTGNNVLDGLDGSDQLFARGGVDVLRGGNGDDELSFGATFASTDQADGGAGADVMRLDGNYTGQSAVIFTANTMKGVEEIRFAAGHSYNLTLNNANIAPAEELTVIGSNLGGADTLTLGGSAETDGRLYVFGGAGNDALSGGAGNDVFRLEEGGADNVHGGGGNDRFYFGTTFAATDQVDGGAQGDTVILNGDYTGVNAATFGAATMRNVEAVSLRAGHSYELTTNDSTVAAGQSLAIIGTKLRTGDSLNFDGSAETDGRFVIRGGAGNDVLAGGDAADQINGGAGADTFVYSSAAQSTGVNYDSITGFDATLDRFDLPGSVAAIGTEVTHGFLARGGNFDAQLATALAGHLAPHGAVLFTPDSGSLHDQTFLVIDFNGDGVYHVGQDIVVHMIGSTGTLGLGDFI